MYDYVLQYGFDKETQDYVQNIKNILKLIMLQIKKEIGFHI